MSHTYRSLSLSTIALALLPVGGASQHIGLAAGDSVRVQFERPIPNQAGPLDPSTRQEVQGIVVSTSVDTLHLMTSTGPLVLHLGPQNLPSKTNALQEFQLDVLRPIHPAPAVLVGAAATAASTWLIGSMFTGSILNDHTSREEEADLWRATLGMAVLGGIVGALEPPRRWVEVYSGRASESPVSPVVFPVLSSDGAVGIGGAIHWEEQ